MPERGDDRKKWRMPCEIHLDGKRYSGFVLDLSSSGLFVQTGVKVRPGRDLEIHLTLPDGEPARLGARVARMKPVPPRLLTVAQGGIGVQITEAPKNFEAFLEGLGIGRGAWAGDVAAGAAPGGSASETDAELGGPRFRVRVAQVSGPRSRRIEVEAADAEAARAAALASVGEGWKVLDVELLP